VIKHEYDSDSLLISFEDGKDTPPLAILFQQLVMKSLDKVPYYQNEAPCVGELFDTNKNPFGKIRIGFLNIENFFCSQTTYIRVKTGPY